MDQKVIIRFRWDSALSSASRSHLTTFCRPFVNHAQWRTQKIFMGVFQSAKIFLCTKIESMIRKNIKQAAIQYVNFAKQL